MNPVSVGTKIRVVRCEHEHSYRVGGVYTVAVVDDDGTFRAADAQGQKGNWLRWSECEPLITSSWVRIAAELPDDLVTFLSCFDGIGELELKETVVDAMLSALPDLHEKVLAFACSPEHAHLVTHNRPQSSNQSEEKKELDT
jgi:hypothetical protein